MRGLAHHTRAAPLVLSNRPNRFFHITMFIKSSVAMTVYSGYRLQYGDSLDSTSAICWRRSGRTGLGTGAMGGSVRSVV